MRKPSFPQFIALLLAAGIMSAIFYYSSQSTTPGITIDEQEGLSLAIRKLAHAVEFGSLALLLRAAFGFLTRLSAFALSFLISLGYAAGDEWHQRFTPGRDASARDVFIDGGGIVTVLVAWWAAELYVTHRRAKDGTTR